MRAMTMFGAPAELIDAHYLGAACAVTPMGAPPIRIDLLSSPTGVTFQHAAIETIRVEIADAILSVIGLAALRQTKQVKGVAKPSAQSGAKRPVRLSRRCKLAVVPRLAQCIASTSSSIGRPSRLPTGFGAPTTKPRACRCQTGRYTRACSCRRAAC